MQKTLSPTLFLCLLLASALMPNAFIGLLTPVQAHCASMSEPSPHTSTSAHTTVSRHVIGDVIDSYNGVAVYFNGPVSNVTERNVASSGYNLGQKYQCVEFVKRYYYQVYAHEMPDSYGNAKDFFNPRVPDGGLNKARGLTQFINGGNERPQAGDIIIFGPASFNRFGHVAIVSEVTATDIEYIQQNPGPQEPSRKRLAFQNGSTRLKSSRLLGWLRKQ